MLHPIEHIAFGAALYAVLSAHLSLRREREFRGELEVLEAALKRLGSQSIEIWREAKRLASPHVHRQAEGGSP